MFIQDNRKQLARDVKLIAAIMLYFNHDILAYGFEQMMHHQSRPTIINDVASLTQRELLMYTALCGYHRRKISSQKNPATKGKKTQGPVVRKPINANPRLKVNRGFHLVYKDDFKGSFLS